MKIYAILATLAAAAHAAPAELSSTATAAAACTTGDPVVTAGYTIKYAVAVPTAVQAGVGYQPDAAWAKQHVAATYTYGVPDPMETGFAYAQFKCQYTCNNAPSGSSFFVQYGELVMETRDCIDNAEQVILTVSILSVVSGQSSSSCVCYNELLDPETFVTGNATMVGAWNAICDVTHPDVPGTKTS